MPPSENKQKMLRGELYYSFTPELMAERERCEHACYRFNNAGEVPRRRLVEMWNEIIGDKKPLPPVKSNPEEDSAQFKNEPWILRPIQVDYGTNTRIGSGAFINGNCVFLDTCLITVGARTLVGPKVSFYSATHPLDPLVRNGLEGPEGGKEIHIGEDCWIGGNAIILAGVTVGRGVTIGAGSVVTKDVPSFHVVAGNPARIIRKIKTAMDPEQRDDIDKDTSKVGGVEEPMAEMVTKLGEGTSPS